MPIAIGTLGLILLVGFALCLTVGVTMGLGGLLLAWLYAGRPVWDILGYVPWNTTTSYTLVALPLFILMGELLFRSGLTERLYKALALWLNPVPGGLLHTNIAASALFSCMSGSSAATAATVSAVAMPSMQAGGHNERSAIGTLAAGGTLGILIPPSVTFIVYGVMAEQSIGQLYLAGILPGLLMAAVFHLVILIHSAINPSIAPRGENAPLKAKLLGLVALLPIFAILALVIGTIYAGVATATEAAAFGIVGALVIAAVNRRLTWGVLRETVIATATTTGMIILVLVGSFLLQFVLAFLGIPTLISNWIASTGLSPFTTVALICLLYLLLGTFMEELSMIVITIPVLLPTLQSLGVDLVWFGVLIVMVVQAGIISPPVGMNLFILQNMRRKQGVDPQSQPITDVFIGVLPYLAGIVVVLVLLLLFPQIALWLPELSASR